MSSTTTVASTTTATTTATSSAENPNIRNSKVELAPVPFFWVRDATGRASVSVTLLIVSFVVTTLAFVLSIFSKIGSVEIRPFDVAACSTYMVPILTLYFSRRWSDARHGITQIREAAQLANRPLTQPFQDSSTMYQYGMPPTNYGGFPPAGV